MRDIKFRAWDISKKKMVNDYDELLINFNGKIQIENYDPWDKVTWYSETKDYIIMQYTGLKDKNGKEIYEGDIVRRKWIQSWDNGLKEFICDSVIIYTTPSFKCKNLDGVGIYTLPINEKFEIIGNIYENPEILEQVK